MCISKKTSATEIKSVTRRFSCPGHQLEAPFFRATQILCPCRIAWSEIQLNIWEVVSFFK